VSENPTKENTQIPFFIGKVIAKSQQKLWQTIAGNLPVVEVDISVIVSINKYQIAILINFLECIQLKLTDRLSLTGPGSSNR
jgi:hypothetical protein